MGATYSKERDHQPSNNMATIKPQQPGGKWKDLFSSNMCVENCSKLVYFSNLEDNIGCLGDVWKNCIVGHLAGKFSKYKALSNIITSSWKCKASLTIYESGWLLHKFLNEEDKVVVLGGGLY